MIEKFQPTVIVTHAEPEGVCDVARKLCRSKAIPLKLHHLNFKFLRGAFEHRSKAVLKDSDHSLFIHDGRSTGTNNEFKLACKMGIECTKHTLEITKYKSSVGFDIDVDWELETTENELRMLEEEEGLENGN